MTVGLFGLLGFGEFKFTGDGGVDVSEGVKVLGSGGVKELSGVSEVKVSEVAEVRETEESRVSEVWGTWAWSLVRAAARAAQEIAANQVRILSPRHSLVF